MLLALGITCVLTLALLAYSLRGRRIDEHPLCRRCGFDLLGKPPESLKCAECGADLTRRRAVRIGHRAMRRSLMLASLALLLVCAGFGGYWVRQWAKTAELIHYEPAWWLVRQARSVHPAARDAALAELARRITTGTLAREREAALVDEAMALQADVNKPWVSGWGTLVEAAHDAGRLPEKRWAAYVFQGYQPIIVPMRPVYRPCDRLEFELRHAGDRVGAMKEPPEWFHVALYNAPEQKLTIAGKEVEDSEFEMSGYHDDLASIPSRPGLWGLCHDHDLGTSATPRVSDVHASSPWPAGLPDHSPVPIPVSVTVLIAPIWAEEGEEAGTPLPDSRPLHLSGSFKVAPAPQVVHDASLKPGVERAVQVENVAFNRDTSNMGPVWCLSADLRVGAPPVDLAFHAKFRCPDNGDEFEDRRRTIYVKAGESRVIPFHGDWFLDPKDYFARTVEIELVPEPTATPVGTQSVWDERLEFKNLAVKGKEHFAGHAPAAQRGHWIYGSD